MGVISVRLDDEQENWLRDRGHKPGTFTRLAVAKEIHRLQVEEAHDFLRKHSIRPRGMSAVEMIRHDRDHGHTADQP